MRVVVAAVLMAATAVRAEMLPCPAKLGADEALRQINALRARAESCGAMALPAAGALRWNVRLAASAQAYAEELAQRDTLSHQGLRASTLRERLFQAGYRMRQSGENLAAGPETLEQALAQWMASPGHCDNLMFKDFQDMGLACVAAPGRYERFWVLHLGRSTDE
jgi:uncharacterized protein YkwD